MNKDFWLKPEPYPYVVIPLAEIQKQQKTRNELAKVVGLGIYCLSGGIWNEYLGTNCNPIRLYVNRDNDVGEI